MKHPFLCVSPDETDGGHLIGRDPRTITESEWAETAPGALVGFKAIRAKCIDCCGGNAAEVRKCVSVTCALWPLRMGRMPKGLAAHRKGETDVEEDVAQ